MAFKKTKIAGATIVALVGAYLLALQIIGNFHEVVPGELYRSAQLSSGDIGRYQKEYHIKTVLNLRGPHPGDAWYDEEIQEAKQDNVNHLDFAMSATKELSDKQALDLIQVMRNAPKPLLIHCRSGADRTGLASAFYVASVTKGTEWAAERQMWIIYGHVPFAISRAVAMNHTFERMEPRFGYHDT